MIRKRKAIKYNKPNHKNNYDIGADIDPVFIIFNGFYCCIASIKDCAAE